MIIFYLNLISIFFYWLLYKLIPNIQDKKNIFLKIIFIQLFIILSLRSEFTGTDTQRYIELYDIVSTYNISYLKEIYNKEFGFIILTKVIQYITDSKQIYIAIIAIISLMGPYILIKNNSKNIFISIIVYITFEQYAFIFSGLRQSIAISIFLIAMEYYKKDKKYIFILLILLANTFHKSVMITLLLILIKDINIPQKLIIYIYILSISYIFKGLIVGLITNYLYSDYANSSNVGGGYSILVLFLLLLSFGYIYGKKYFSENKNSGLFYNMIGIALILQVYASVEGNINRLVMYFSTFLVIYIPMILYFFKNKKLRVLLSYITIIILISKYLIGINNSALVKSYSLFWK